MTIFLVDDDADDRELFVEAAGEFDKEITCIEAENGEKALLYLKDIDHPVPDFIFLDLRMPGMSGRQCLEEIKKDVRLQKVPVIIYTTSRDVRESAELKRLGAVHFMSKPVLADDVFYMLSVVLAEKWD